LGDADSTCSEAGKSNFRAAIWRSVKKAARCLETLGVVAVAQAVDADAAIAIRRMNKACIADIDADMRKRSIAGIEEYEIART